MELIVRYAKTDICYGGTSATVESNTTGTGHTRALTANHQ